MKKEDNTIRDRFTFFRSFQEVIERFEEDDQLKIYRGIVKFALDGEEPKFNNPTVEMMWILMKPVLRKSEVRRDAGKTGGKNGKGISRNIGNQHAAKTKAKQKQINSKSKAKQKQINSDMDNGYMDMDNGYMDNVSIETKEDIEETTAEPSVSLSPEYSNFRDWLRNNCPHLLKMDIPTEDEYNKLLKAADNNQNILSNKLLAMNDRKDVPKNYRSIYRTCLNWLNRDKK